MTRPMAIKERNSAKGTERSEALAQGPLAKLNAFGEKHAKLIITISVVLLIATVLLFAKVLYDRSVTERAEKDIAAADTPEKLKELKKKYKDSPVLARITYQLGNRYYDEGKLKDAQAEYNEFLEKFKDHPLAPMVIKALVSLNSNIRFLEEEKERRLKAPTLQTHPETRIKINNDPLRYGPVKKDNPIVVVDLTGKGKFTIELFEDAAPNAVANFIKLVEEKYFDGLKFTSVRNLEALDIMKKESGPKDYLLPAEDSGRERTEGALIMRKAENRPELLGAEFEILLRDAPDLKEGVVFGTVSEYMHNVKQITGNDTIASMKVEKKRPDSKYEPQTIKP